MIFETIFTTTAWLSMPCCSVFSISEAAWPSLDGITVRAKRCENVVFYIYLKTKKNIFVSAQEYIYMKNNKLIQSSDSSLTFFKTGRPKNYYVAALHVINLQSFRKKANNAISSKVEGEDDE